MNQWDKWLNGWMNKLMDKWMNEWMDEWMNSLKCPTKISTKQITHQQCCIIFRSSHSFCSKHWLATHFHTTISPGIPLWGCCWWCCRSHFSCQTLCWLYSLIGWFVIWCSFLRYFCSCSFLYLRFLFVYWWGFSFWLFWTDSFLK